MTRWIEVKSFSNQIEAEVAKSTLESIGIKSLVYIDDAGGIGNYYLILKRISLLVPQEDVAKARRILNNLIQKMT